MSGTNTINKYKLIIVKNYTTIQQIRQNTNIYAGHSELTNYTTTIQQLYNYTTNGESIFF